MEIRRDLLVGVCGDIGSGKDQVANHLARAHCFQTMSLADKLKRTIVDVLALDHRYLFGTQAEKNEAIPILGHVAAEPFGRLADPWPARVGDRWTGRYLAEFIGTEVFRSIFGRVWIDNLFRQIKAQRDAAGRRHQRHVIPDVRFANEIDAIREEGGVIWRVTRMGHVSERTGHTSDDGWRAHPVDAHIIAADGDLDDLYAQVDVEMNRLEFGTLVIGGN